MIDDYVETTNTLSFRARVTSGPAYAVVSVVQDGGWSARDRDGARFEIRRANGPFLAVVLPEGEHEVVLTYRSPGFGIGAAISLAAAIGIAGLAYAVDRRSVSASGVGR